MMKKSLLAVLVVGASMSAATLAKAGDFYATPLNSGAPTNLPGETLIPGMTQAMMVVNGVTQPILQPILAPGPLPAAAPEPMMMRHHRMMRHHMHHKMMMKKKMMSEKAM
jgi:hypothetical protein